MSQSDYIQFTKTVELLNPFEFLIKKYNFTKLPAVFDEQDYTAFKKFNLETKVIDKYISMYKNILVN